MADVSVSLAVRMAACATRIADGLHKGGLSGEWTMMQGFSGRACSRRDKTAVLGKEKVRYASATKNLLQAVEKATLDIAFLKVINETDISQWRDAMWHKSVGHLNKECRPDAVEGTPNE